MNATSLSASPTTGAALGPPALTNQTPEAWAEHQFIGMTFARHVRHEMVNLQCSLQMIDVIENAQLMGANDALPPELAPAELRIRARVAMHQVVSYANDMVLLSQAAMTCAYRTTHTLPVRDWLTLSVEPRLGTFPRPEKLLNFRGEAQIVAMGDMLHAALAACYFQWTPNCTTHTHAAQARANCAGTRLSVIIPGDDVEMIQGFARRLAAVNRGKPNPVCEQCLSIPVGEMALWMARFIILLHGGHVHVEVDDPETALRIELPLAG